jgi:hypothetical protein
VEHGMAHRALLMWSDGICSLSLLLHVWVHVAFCVYILASRFMLSCSLFFSGVLWPNGLNFLS